jgi:hypothetical protein
MLVLLEFRLLNNVETLKLLIVLTPFLIDYRKVIFQINPNVTNGHFDVMNGWIMLPKSFEISLPLHLTETARDRFKFCVNSKI